MADVYPELDDLKDEVWIEEQTALGRVLLTKDRAIRRNSAEQRAVAVSRARLFCVSNAGLTGHAVADRLVERRHQILQRAAKRGPYIYVVHATRVELVFPLPTR